MRLLHQLHEWKQQYVHGLETYGITYNSIFAEYVVVPARAVHKLPDNVSFVDAACLEPISLTVPTSTQVKPMLGDTVAIFGPGAISLSISSMSQQGLVWS